MDSYSQMKRKIYLWVLPIFVLYNAWYLVSSAPSDTFIRVSLPLSLLVAFALWIAMLRQRAIVLTDLLGILMFSLYHLGRVYTGDATFPFYLPWSGLVYVYIFLVLESRRGLVVALVLYVLSLIAGIPHLVGGSALSNMLVQFYITNLIYIVVLYFFKRILMAQFSAQTWIEVAHRDYLTGIANRRLIDQWIQLAVEAGPPGRSTALIFLDIDHFKLLNDAHGHHVGDQVLREFVRVIQSSLAADDRFGRWGGEEFVILRSVAGTSEAEQFADFIRKEIEAHAFASGKHLTASLGVAVARADDTPGRLALRADTALYRAKEQGRNRTVILDSTPETIDVPTT